jgi:hypothetical protein
MLVHVLCLCLSGRLRKSYEDSFTYHGTWPVEHDATHYAFVHIPKTAGSSFLADSPKHLPVKSTMNGNGERDACTVNRPLPQVAVMIRSPKSHVYSMFLECKYDTWGIETTRGSKFPRDNSTTSAGFEEWLDHFQLHNNDFNCYYPRNLQTRRMGCSIDQRHGRLNVTAAHNMVRNIGFVGITDHYAESICAFEVFVSNTTKCTCVNGTLSMHAPVTHITHFVPPHSLRELTPRHIHLINNLTQEDDKLYAMARSRFWKDVDAASAISGVDIKCSV